MKALIPLALLLSLALPVGAHTVCAVRDGDTFTLCRSGQKVRLWGIDSPELKQPMGQQARQALESLVLGREVALTCKSKSYSRSVCSVGVNGVSVQREMTRRGWAFDEPRYSHGAFKGEEAEARQAGRGVWSQPSGGVRPWVFRKR